MARARALVGHFPSSSQASEALASVQRRGVNSKDLKVIQDVVTRWWSTWKMIQRLRMLKNYLGILVEEGVLDPDTNLSDEEWQMLEEIEKLLEPFMVIQRLLEGQKYVTLSLVPYLIGEVRENLVIASKAGRTSAVRDLAQRMLSDPVRGMDMYWGKGAVNTLYDENNKLGRGNRQKGLPLSTLLAAALDPRMKTLKGIGSEDKDKIWGELRRRMAILLQEKNENDAEESTSNLICREGVKKAVDTPMADLFRGLEDEDSDNEGNDVENNGIRNSHDVAIDVEIAYYKNVKKLGMFLPEKDKNGCEIFSDPLIWWQLQSKTLPLLSTLARRILCIPATSAPSERVFSSAGLTISKCRASLQPQHASELIFLHDSWEFAEECDLKRRTKVVMCLRFLLPY